MMSGLQAWQDGAWLPQHAAHLALDDWGLLQAAIVVDRLRTVRHLPLDVESHLQRLVDNCLAVGIMLSDVDVLQEVIGECAHRNSSQYQEVDFAIVTLVTPGRGMRPEHPTVIIHTAALPREAIRHWHRQGQDLLIASARNVPACCWSPQIKTRSRLQYYLADSEARQSGQRFAGAVLLDTAGFLTETSSANLILVTAAGDLVVAPEQSILPGISLDRTLRLAVRSGFAIERRLMSLDDVTDCTEVILTGTSGCIWPASRLGAVEFSDAINRPVYQRLLTKWVDELQFDFTL